MKLGITALALIGVIVLLLAFGTLWNGAMSQAYDDLNQSVALDSPNRVGVDIGHIANSGVSGLIFPAAILSLGAFAMIGLWAFVKSARGR